MIFTPAIAHPWDVSIAEARHIQQVLANKVIIEDRFTPPALVAGVDVGFEDNGRITRAAIAILSFPALNLIDKSIARTRTTFPYVPGYLSFRELPAVLAALDKIQIHPDMFLCDGQGIAHPRRFGIACHLGLLTDTPSIGVAKSRLLGEYTEPGAHKGDWEYLHHEDDNIGVVLRTRSNVKPLFVSPGHRISISGAKDMVMACVTRFRLPETTRHAHKLASG